MPYTFRNREEIRAPARLHDPDGQTRHASYQESDADMEVYAPTPQSSKLKYRGPIIQFNPFLPSAAFPTIELLRKVPTPALQALVPCSKTPPIPASSSSDVPPSPPPTSNILGHVTPPLTEDDETEFHSSKGSAVETPGSGRCDCQVRLWTRNGKLNEPDVNYTHRNRAAAVFKNIDNEPAVQSCTYQSHGLDGIISMESPRRKRVLQRCREKIEESTFADNMKRMEHAGEMDDYNRSALDFMTSDEEEDTREQDRKGLVCWDDLTVAHKVQMWDILAKHHPHPHDEIAGMLRLKDNQIRQMRNLLLERDVLLSEEDADGAKHRAEIHQKLLHGVNMTPEQFRRSLEENVYGGSYDPSEGVFNHSTASHVKQAKMYFSQCGFDSKLLAAAWATIPGTVAAEFGQHRLQAELVNICNDHSLDAKSCSVSDDTISPSTSSTLQTRQVPSNDDTISPPTSPTLRNRQIPSNDDTISPSTSPTLRTCQIPPTLRQRPSKVFRAPGRLVGRKLPRVDKQEPVKRGPALNLEIPHAQESARKQGHSNTKGVLSSPTVLDEHTLADGGTPGSAKRRGYTDPETSFLGNLGSERRSGARQPKLSEKALEAAASSKHALKHTPTSSGKHPDSGRLTKTDVVPASSSPSRNQRATKTTAIPTPPFSNAVTKRSTARYELEDY